MYTNVVHANFVSLLSINTSTTRTESTQCAFKKLQTVKHRPLHCVRCVSSARLQAVTPSEDQIGITPGHHWVTRCCIVITDIIGVVKSTGDVATITTKTTNRELTKRELQIIDDSEKIVTLTLWGSEVKIFHRPVISQEFS